MVEASDTQGGRGCRWTLSQRGCRDSGASAARDVRARFNLAVDAVGGDGGAGADHVAGVNVLQVALRGQHSTQGAAQPARVAAKPCCVSPCSRCGRW